MGFESLAILAVLITLAIPVAVIALIVGHARLRRRVEHLEAALARLPSERPVPASAVGPWAAAARAAVEAPPAVDPATPDPIPVAADRAVDMPEAADASAPVAADIPVAPPVAPRAARTSALADWVVQNWVYVVSAASLALAGIFFVQYGIENGLLSPAMRVLLAIGFGGALIAGGEWIRRRHGDDEGAATAYLPSVFSGAGIVSIFGGIVAARQLYGLIGPELGFTGLVATALGAIALGWFHGPLLAAVGLIGATLAPFLVGGSTDSADWLYGYMAIVAFAGLAIDAIRRWAWVSVLAVVLAFAGGGFVLLAAGGTVGFALLLAALVVLAVAVPARGLWPDHAAPAFADWAMARGRTGAPSFPVRLAAGTVIVATVALVLVSGANPGTALALLAVLLFLVLALAIWAAPAPGLADLAAIPAIGFLLRLAFEALDYGPLYADFAARALDLRAPETAAPATAGLMLAMATAGTLAAAWRSFGEGARSASAERGLPRAALWAAGAALFAPVAALVLDLLWQPARVIGAYPWALHVIALATLMGILAERFARADGDDRRRAAYAVLSCLSLIALALFLVTTKAALTLALAVLVVAAAALDRRYRLPEMGWFIQAGVLVLGWRLIVDPGFTWGMDAPLLQVLPAFLGAIAGLAAVLWLLRPLDRRGAAVFAESGLAAYLAILANVLITRFVLDRLGGGYLTSYWSVSLNATPWIVLMLVQLHRWQLGGWMRWIRGGIAAVAGIAGLGGLAVAVWGLNPLFPTWQGDVSGLVLGPPLIDTLLIAYGLPAILFVLAIRWMPHLHPWLRKGFLALGALLGVLYAALEIRRFWQGDDLSVPGVTQAELYSYTVAMLVAGAALLWQAIARRDAVLRRVAMGVIAVTVAKVFLVDASGLTGLTRVFSFLALGLSLAALAWLNRWAAGRQGSDDAPLPPGDPPV